MPEVTIVSTEKPALLAEVARLTQLAEAALTPALSRVSINLAGGLMSITGTIAGQMSVDPANGKPVFSPANHTLGTTLALTGTPLAGRGIDSLAEALFACLIDLAAAEDAYLADGTKTLPTGVDVAYSVNGVNVTMNAVVPFTVSLNAQGQQLLTVPNYLA